MAPSFLRSLRRRSKASIRTDQSVEPSTEQPRVAGPYHVAEQNRTPDQYHTDSSSDASRGTVPTTGTLTPPSTHGSDPALDKQLQVNGSGTHPRPGPQPLGSTSKRSSIHSVSGMSGLGAPSHSGHSTLPKSEFEPRFLNAPGARPVHQKCFLLRGTVGDPSRHTVDDGYITITSANQHFPATSWPVRGSYWKAAIYLEPGMNELKFTTWAPKLANNNSSNPIHTAYLNINMVPPHCAPPLQLAILLAKDSPETFDSTPARIDKDGNGLAAAVRKYRTSAYLWQAFTTEQMRRHSMGPRCFTFEEEWGSSTSHLQDRENGVMRSEARVHIIRTDKTVSELRSLKNDDLFGAAAEAVKDYFRPLPTEKRYVSVMLMDTHWDVEAQETLGHVAKGGQFGDMHIAVFGSHCLQSYPSGLDEVALAFEDCTRTDPAFAANDDNKTGSSWEAASLGIGSSLREVCRMFGCPPQKSGIMSDDAYNFNRTFITMEPFATKTKSKAGLVLDKDECSLHRLDALRLRFHPCFKLPSNAIYKYDDSVQVFPVDTGKLILIAKSGITHVEIWTEGDEFCEAWIGMGAERGLPREYCLSEQDLKDRLPEQKHKSPVRLKVFSGGGGCVEIDNFKKLCSKESTLKLTPGPLAKTAFRSRRVGCQTVEGTGLQEVVFTSSIKQNRILLRVVAYHDNAQIYGVEFVYDDNSTQLLGIKQGKEGGDVVEFDIWRGEYISGFYVRAGNDKVFGLGIMTSLGNCSPIFGDPFGGVTNNIIPPQGLAIYGVTGTGASCLESFGVIVAQ